MNLAVDAVTTRDLTKKFGKTSALSSVDLTIPQGAEFACVGERDSGKTTLLRLLCGLYAPSAGSCFVMGLSPSNNPPEVHKLIGAVLNSSKLYMNLSLYENMMFFAKIDGVEHNDAVDRASFLLHRLGVWEDRDTMPGELPSGLAYRGRIAVALIHRPNLLLFDQPREGIDADSRIAVKLLLDELSEEEKLTVVFSTENYAYAEDMCSVFGVFDKGRLLASGSASELVGKCKARSIAVLKLAESDLPPEEFKMVDGTWQKEIESEDEMPQIISMLNSQGKRLLEAKVQKPRLKDVSGLLLKTHLETGDQFAGEKSDEPEESKGGFGGAEGYSTGVRAEPGEPSEGGDSAETEKPRKTES